MKIALRLSLALNVVLLVALGIALWQLLMLVTYRDARPEGPPLILEHDLSIHDGARTAFVLPAGTRLQQSTPQGMATLGKNYGAEYIILIHSDSPDLPPPDTHKEQGWMEPYHFYTLSPATPEA